MPHFLGKAAGKGDNTMNGNEYKRNQAAPGLKVTAKAFGSGRRNPIAQRFRQ